MHRRLALIAVAAVLVAGCGASSSPSPSPSPTPSPTPTVAPTPSPTPTAVPTPSPSVGPFDGQPYALDVPDGWQTFDLSNPDSKAAIDAVAGANPGLAASIKTFESLPNVRMSVNSLLGNVMVSLAVPSQGLPLETIGQNFSSQFAAIPGLASPRPPTTVTLPAGPALHWLLHLTAKKPGGGSFVVTESIYLVVNSQAAVIVEFVVLGSGTVPTESAIIQSFRFQP